MNICIPTTLREHYASEEADGPFLLSALTPEGVPIFCSTNSIGECETFNTLDGALLWAMGFIDVRPSPQSKEYADRVRQMYDRPGAALLFLDRTRRRLDEEADKDQAEDQD